MNAIQFHTAVLGAINNKQVSKEARIILKEKLIAGSVTNGGYKQDVEFKCKHLRKIFIQVLT